ncbi:MAG: hypothetical protein P8J20_02825 [Novosphingobium sp.]|nr:hypothetical protein [Novosphingobium sp.]
MATLSPAPLHDADHVHIVRPPTDEQGLSRTFGEVHRRYTGYVNALWR